jgi:hypothetical protein
VQSGLRRWSQFLYALNPSGHAIRKQLIVGGRVNKYVAIGSKTDVMVVINFLCVSVGSSTVQLHGSLGSRRACTCSEASFSSQNGDRA